MKQNKVVLPLIIFLLLCFLPCSIYGLYFKLTEKNEMGNPNHFHKFEGKLYYYDKKDNLIGTYTCETNECDNAFTSVDDEHIDVYKGEKSSTEVFSSEYVFIQDGDVIKLHNLKNNFTIVKLLMIKNYGTKLENNSMIVKNESGLYGLLNLDTITFTIAPEYDFMGLVNIMEDNVLQTDKIVVQKQNNWFLISNDGKELSKTIPNPIINFDDNYIYSKLDNTFVIYDYNGVELIRNVSNYATIKDYNLVSKDGMVYIYDISYQNIIRQFGNYGQILDFKIEEDIVNIYNGTTLIDTFDPSAGV